MLVLEGVGRLTLRLRRTVGTDLVAEMGPVPAADADTAAAVDHTDRVYRTDYSLAVPGIVALLRTIDTK